MENEGLARILLGGGPALAWHASSLPPSESSWDLIPVLSTKLTSFPGSKHTPNISRFPAGPSFDPSEWMGRHLISDKVFRAQADVFRRSRAEAISWRELSHREKTAQTSRQAAGWESVVRTCLDEINETLLALLREFGSDRYRKLPLDQAFDHRLDDLRGLRTALPVWEDAAEWEGSRGWPGGVAQVCSLLDKSVMTGENAREPGAKQAFLKSTDVHFRYACTFRKQYKVLSAGDMLTSNFRFCPQIYIHAVVGWPGEPLRSLVEGLQFPPQASGNTVVDLIVSRALVSERLMEASVTGNLSIMTECVWPVYKDYLDEVAQYGMKILEAPIPKDQMEVLQESAQQVRDCLEATRQLYSEEVLACTKEWQKAFTLKTKRMGRKGIRLTESQKEVCSRMKSRMISNEVQSIELVDDRVRLIEEQLPSYIPGEYETGLNPDETKTVTFARDKAARDLLSRQHVAGEVDERYLEGSFTFRELLEEARSNQGSSSTRIDDKALPPDGPGEKLSVEVQEVSPPPNDKEEVEIGAVDHKLDDAVVDIRSEISAATEGRFDDKGTGEVRLEMSEGIDRDVGVVGRQPAEDDSLESETPDPEGAVGHNHEENQVGSQTYYPEYKTDAFDWANTTFSRCHPSLLAMSFGDFNSKNDYLRTDILSAGRLPDSDGELPESESAGL